MNELREIFNRVNVVVWWRGNELYAWLRVTQASDDAIYLVTGSWPPSPGLAP